MIGQIKTTLADIAHNKSGVIGLNLTAPTIERDMLGTLHIKLGEFDFVQIQYQYPYTDNASTRVLAEKIVEIICERKDSAK